MAITKIQSESLNLADTYAFTGTVTGAGGVNTPYFAAYEGAQTITSGTPTKLTMTSFIDSGNNYDDTNYRFTVPAGQGGKYWFSLHGQPFQANSSTNGGALVFYKNGSTLGNQYQGSLYQISTFRNHYITTNGIITLAAGDYVEGYGYATYSSGSGGVAYVKMFGYKLIE